VGLGTAGGFLLYDHLAEPDPQTALSFILPMAAAGAVMAIPGIVMWIKSIYTYERFIEEYRPDPYEKIVIGPTENGIGLAVRF
jgi:hypothetical protein